MRVGVIAAARAPVPFLDEALESALRQEPAPDAVVVVDHASAPPLALPEGVRSVRLEDAGGGPARARQAGLEAIRDCDLVALLDADDAWEPGKLAAQVAALERHPEAAVCFGRALVVDAAGRPTGERLPEAEPGLHADAPPADVPAPDAGRFARLLYERNPIPASSALVRREALEAVGGFEPDVSLPAASDWHLWLRLAEAGYAFLCVPEARIRYRRHGGGLTANVSRLAEAGLAVHERFAGLVPAEVARSARARDLETLARGRIRERRYAEARSALAEASTLDGLAPRERALRVLLAVPGLRGALGRRSPYPG